MKRPDKTELILLACLGAALLSAIIGSVWLAFDYSRKERRSLLEAGRIRSEMRLHEARTPPSAEGSSSGESLIEQELATAVQTLATVDADQAMAPDERSRRLNAAFVTFDAYVKAKPNDAPSYFRRGRCHDLLGRIPEALADYQKAIDLEPKLTADLSPRIRELRQVVGK